MVDRYSAYKAMAQVKLGNVVLVFCWAHVRRDFVKLVKGWPEHKAWAWPGSGEFATCIAIIVSGESPRLAYVAQEELVLAQIRGTDLEKPAKNVVKMLENRCSENLF